MLKCVIDIWYIDMFWHFKFGLFIKLEFLYFIEYKSTYLQIFSQMLYMQQCRAAKTMTPSFNESI